MYWLWWMLALMVAMLCASIAARKGYSPLLWAILGVFFFISVIVLLILPDKNGTA